MGWRRRLGDDAGVGGRVGRPAGLHRAEATADGVGDLSALRLVVLFWRVGALMAQGGTMRWAGISVQFGLGRHGRAGGASAARSVEAGAASSRWAGMSGDGSPGSTKVGGGGGSGATPSGAWVMLEPS
ncbi:hypothetical protein BH18ACT2_BH18ACT2_15750 [soil metagenome]